MTVTVAASRIQVEPIADLSEGVWIWHGYAYGTGDNSGGEIQLSVYFDSYYMFGGKWYFTLESFSTWGGTDYGANGVVTVQVQARTEPTIYIYPEWERKYDITRYEGRILQPSCSSDIPRFLWKPKQASVQPQIWALIYPNVNAMTYNFRCHGYVIREGSAASLMFAAR